MSSAITTETVLIIHYQLLRNHRPRVVSVFWVQHTSTVLLWCCRNLGSGLSSEFSQKCHFWVQECWTTSTPEDPGEKQKKHPTTWSKQPWIRLPLVKHVHSRRPPPSRRRSRGWRCGTDEPTPSSSPAGPPSSPRSSGVRPRMAGTRRGVERLWPPEWIWIRKWTIEMVEGVKPELIFCLSVCIWNIVIAGLTSPGRTCQDQASVLGRGGGRLPGSLVLTR